MNISNYYWYFKSALPTRLCDHIIKHGLSQAEQIGRTADYGNKEILI